MSSGPAHYRIAEQLIEDITKPDPVNPRKRILQPGDHYAAMALAQVHAALAMAAAYADTFDEHADAWKDVTS